MSFIYFCAQLMNIVDAIGSKCSERVHIHVDCNSFGTDIFNWVTKCLPFSVSYRWYFEMLYLMTIKSFAHLFIWSAGNFSLAIYFVLFLFLLCITYRWQYKLLQSSVCLFFLFTSAIFLEDSICYFCQCYSFTFCWV